MGGGEKFLLPRYLRRPELRDFYADFGLQAKKMGVTCEEEIAFPGFPLQQLTRTADGYYIANSTCNIGGLECMITFDFGQEALDMILKALPASQASHIRTALTRMPYAIDVDAKVRIHWNARLGEPIQGPYEEFIPMIVTKLVKAEYDDGWSPRPQGH